MPVITFDKEHLDEGFMFLARRGEVGCFPNDVFVVTEPLFDQLKESGIPFIRLGNHQTAQQGEVSAKKKTRKTSRKVSV
jgi:hypothetical protein